MLQTEVKLVTPALAKQWLDNNLYENQRPLQYRWVKFLANEMTNGNFKSGTTIKFAKYNGNTILIDGQHRLKAIFDSKCQQEMIVTYETINSDRELAESYSYIDIGAYRKWSDVIRAIGKEDIFLNKKETNILKSAMGTIYRGFMSDGIRESNIMMYQKTLEWQPYAKTFFDAIEGSSPAIKRPLTRLHVAALAISTIRFSNDKIGKDRKPSDFWYQVAFDDGLRLKDPRKKLRDLLIESQVVSTFRKDRNISAKQCFMYATRAWNAWVNNEEISRLMLPQSKLAIACTPFDYSMSIDAYRECFENSDWGQGWQ